MCDPRSFTSAFADVGGAYAARMDANSMGDFAEANAKAMAMFAVANTRQSQDDAYFAFAEQAKLNIGMMTLTGLDPASFASIEKGNREALTKNIDRLEAGGQTEAQRLIAQGALDKAAARSKGAAAFWDGFLSAGYTLDKAEQTYQDANLGESRVEYAKNQFKNSFIGSTFFQE